MKPGVAEAYPQRREQRPMSPKNENVLARPRKIMAERGFQKPVESPDRKSRADLYLPRPKILQNKNVQGKAKPLPDPFAS